MRGRMSGEVVLADAVLMMNFENDETVWLDTPGWRRHPELGTVPGVYQNRLQ
jgi:hypothetical protein